MSRSASSAGPRAAFPLHPAAILMVCVVGLLILGLTILFSASASYKQGPYYYLNKQLIGVLLATLACVVASRIDLEGLRRYVWVIGIGAAVALVLVLVPPFGVSVNGSSRWLGLGPVRVQASEFAKLALVFCLAHYLALNQTRIGEFKRGFLVPLGIIAGFSTLIVVEPDFGTAALTLAVGLTLVFLAGARWRYILPTLAVALAGFVALVIHNPNRLRRFTAFLDVEGNKLG
ncbi:MAG TPA: FtsW/RodA/SpoVE family cell cycle protein, partial [Candidatus Synoicihabitans sp.]|nr:FtsW/RodA/SpoVE family cell cycle protein [Candidatus Synoicihabitans sp.]